MAEEKTGYPHIDKPWLKFYKQDYNLEYPDCSITTYLKGKTTNFGNDVAMSYYKREFTYDEFWNRVDMASKVLNELGAGINDRIMYLVPNIPESGEIWLGASQIGVTSDFIDPRPDSMDMKANAQKVLEIMKHEKTKYIIALDQCYMAMLRPIENELKDLGIEQIVVLSPTDSMTFSGTIDYLKDTANYEKIALDKKGVSASRLKSLKAVYNKIKMMKSMQEAYNNAKSKSPLEIVEYKDLLKEINYSHFNNIDDASLVSYIGHTSGTTTGRPKPIPLTHRNLIAANEHLLSMGISNGHGKKVLHLLPFFAPFGASNNYLLGISRGSYNINVPEFQISEVGYLLKKYHPNLIMGTPSWMSSLVTCPYLAKDDLSYLQHITYGGDSMTMQDEKALEKWLEEHNSKAKIVKGHGMSECCGCSSYSQEDYSRYEAIGIPLPGTIYTIVNPDNNDELEPLRMKEGDKELRGELVISSAAVTPGILDGEVIVPHYELDGKDYIRTKDIVTMDKDGIFYFNSRKDRMFTRFDGFKVKPYIIEEKIEDYPPVKYCRVTGYYDDFVHGLMPIAHIVLKDNVENLSEEDLKRLTERIVNDCIISNPNMSSRQIPRKFKYRVSMPLTKNSKVNFNALAAESLDGTEITVDVDENNISVGSITVLGPSDVKKLSKNKKND